MRHTFMPRIIRTGVLAAVATAAACGLSDAAGSAPNLIADPPSTLLAPGTTELTLTVRSTTATECRYASREVQEIAVGAGYRRLSGEQAPRHQWILDDAGAGFSTAGAWTAVSYDSGEWQASGPFYHDWGEGCHQSSGSGDEARWELAIPEQDFYTITAWWPAAPSSGSWSRSAVYEVMAGGAVVGSATLDQSSGGDEWHEVAEVLLVPDDGAFVRLRSGDAAPAIADALHLRSAARFNDGSPVDVVTLQPMDGIVLAKIPSDHGVATMRNREVGGPLQWTWGGPVAAGPLGQTRVTGFVSARAGGPERKIPQLML